MKREKYIDWDSLFIGMAALTSFRSKDPSTRHGAVIVDLLNRVISVGYNGFPRDCNDDEFPWTKPEKYEYVVHAEENAMFNATRSMNGSKLYLYSEKGYYPCSRCARGIVQCGIKEIIMASAINDNTETYDWSHTKKMFDSVGIKIRVLENSEKIFSDLISEFNSSISSLK